MLADIDSSINQMKDYRETNLFKQNSEVECSIKVLTGGSWPRFNKEASKNSQGIPKEITTLMDAFSTYYMSTYQQNRKIDWSLDHGSAEVHFQSKHANDKKKYRVTMSTRQTCIVYMFNSVTMISCETMMAHMGTDKNTV